jgi:acyl-CoA reductase-like NAD-dependent aldehyde dehydrogenase
VDAVHIRVQVCEYAIGVPALTLGDTSPSVAKDMDIQSYRVPLGVTAGICPYVFPLAPVCLRSEWSDLVIEINSAKYAVH